MEKKRVVIIGGGPGGYVAGLRAAALGGDVTIIEKENLGGTCLNWGCIPSKIMKNSADLFLKCLKAAPLGIKIDKGLSFDIKVLMDRKNNILDSQRKAIASLLNSRGIQVEKGRARIKSKGAVEFFSHDSSVRQLEYDKLIIAAGTKPMNMPDFPFDHEKIVSSNDILELKKIPESLTIVGGGVIGCEFAFIFASLGTRVTLVEGMSRLLPLPSVDTEISKLLLREMKKSKIKVICDTVVTRADISGDGVKIFLGISPFTDNPKPKPVKSDLISTQTMAVCIGRTPLSNDLGLENIKLSTDAQGWIQANDKMETSVENVYAIGDILGPSKIMLAHVASHEGMIAAENAMGMESKMAYDVVPGAVFTMPEIGMAGLSQAEAEAKGFDVETASVNFRILGKAQAIDEIAGQAKMIIEKKTNKVLGVHLMGPHATDIIAQACLALKQGVTADQIAHTIHAHPTLGEIMGELSLKACGMPIHG